MSPTDNSPLDLVTVDTALAEFVDRQRARWAGVDPELTGFIDAAADFVADGKRMRPLFCLAGWRAASGTPADSPAPAGVVTAAAAWEWLQGSALVHDDLMDASDTRRGRPSVHRAFEQRHRDELRVGDPVGFGAGTAILLGDLMLSWCDEMLRHAATVDPSLASGEGALRLAEAFAVLDTCKSEVTFGQYLDMVAQTRAEVDADAAMLVVTFKSAKYTIERPLHLGAVLGGADQSLLDRLSAVAMPLGAAFQLRDDVLGVFGDPATTGKPAGDDLREGKRTLLVARALARLPLQDAERLSTVLGTPEGVGEATALVLASGGLDDVEAAIDRHAAEATAALSALPDVARATLEPLIERSVRRDR
ncbi:polyprenyl synthetase family protein [Aeromicrobium sp. Leaf350]|uniref:polyprenyl synthetase family protein n=1 Tax=Aeromicrobium sp. Leaf350 TaxID=2876565 RepID=UPI001E4AA569|nr:polyprenyl synthetase family protein [Aeromicrobium sp. Leaf350]